MKIMKTKVGSQWNDIVQCGRYCSAQTKDVWTYRVCTRKFSRRNYCQRDDSWNCGRGSWKCMEQESHLLQALYKYMLSVAFAFPDRNGDWPWVPDEMHVSSSFTILSKFCKWAHVSRTAAWTSRPGSFLSWEVLVQIAIDRSWPWNGWNKEQQFKGRSSEVWFLLQLWSWCHC